MTARDGTRLWRTALRSPGSKGIRIEFRNFDVGDGKVWVHDGSNTSGPFTGKGEFGNGTFWSAPIASESVVVEYQPGANDLAMEPPFQLATLSHKAYADDGWGNADYCNLDPNCYQSWQPTMQMVGQMVFETDEGEAACTGTLVATRDNSAIPYLLTAGHCINNEASARSLVVNWTYQTSSCGSTPPTDPTNSTKSLKGGHLVSWATIDQGDYSLVLLQDIPPGLTFSGWDTADPPQGSNLTGVHHPHASWKRISFGNRIGDETVDVEGVLAPADKYFVVQWSQGVTEQGSSGSGLFTSPGILTGTLTYGPAVEGLTACEIVPTGGGYARFSNTYAALHDYFENTPSSLIAPAHDVSFTISNHTAPAAQTVALTTQTPGQVSYKLRADAPWIKLSSIIGNVSAKSPASASIQMDPAILQQPGTYTSTVTILSGAAAPQYINVTAKVQASQSNVQVSINPNPVHQDGNGVWSFTIMLNETAGSATTVSGMRINGVDYSSSLASWFGATHINARANLTDTLNATNVPSGNQTFEFWGVDDGSGTTWYRSVTVSFQ